MDIKQVKRSSYVCSKNGKSAKVEFSRVGRYDTFDGKCHPAWLVSYNGNLKVCIDKKNAFAFAEDYLNGRC